ncbi:hypothetical protein F6R98_02430 [Candidatus Methylospira mobilis]|uniref:DUF2782 domain-containing protein n=1 Tax=Candidatus Methylospira mobilis TaxID=1808979 RepID=A0A5Q0BHD6_9GAMM|nr:hypothetical protein [Candidatus Methylospira mobilis]QFY41621.1 hypothetical protein F6R98_02430 [Candidatus Methylospira mobilis]WNV05130.1 hypothetical protein RP726_01665 [Candidatus Methylospira mobilis]
MKNKQLLSAALLALISGYGVAGSAQNTSGSRIDVYPESTLQQQVLEPRSMKAGEFARFEAINARPYPDDYPYPGDQGNQSASPHQSQVLGKETKQKTIP